MRSTRTVTAAVAAAVAVGLLATSAPTQRPSDPPSSAIVQRTELTTTPEGRDRSYQLFMNLQDLRRAEDGYHSRHGRYTAKSEHLSNFEYQPLPAADISVTAGESWVVIRGEIPGIAIQQITVWRREGPHVENGAFGQLREE